MNAWALEVVSWGIYSDQFANAAALAAAVQAPGDGNKPVELTSASVPSATNADLLAAISGLDAVSQYAFRALHEARHSTTAEPLGNALDRIALLLLSTWGAMDNTTGFLDSMWEADGRYASPRLFTRSVYSTVASHAAIHFGIHGPCETLAHGHWPVTSVLDRAADLLNARRVDYVVACWAEQHSDIAKDLCRRCVNGLGRQEYARFTGDQTGYGAVAAILKRVERNPGLVLRLQSGIASDSSASTGSSMSKLNVHPFPSDGAIQLAATFSAAQNGSKPEPVYYTESAPRGQFRTVQVQHGS
jgi:hypothetical protein